jgi:hypothetical protein
VDAFVVGDYAIAGLTDGAAICLMACNTFM